VGHIEASAATMRGQAINSVYRTKGFNSLAPSIVYVISGAGQPDETLIDAYTRLLDFCESHEITSLSLPLLYGEHAYADQICRESSL
jgi:hypothetical protein